MTFDEWWRENKTTDFYNEEDIAREAWEAGISAAASECERMVMYPNAISESSAHDNVWSAAKAIRELRSK